MLAERRRWLESDPGRYALLEPEGEPLLLEFLEMAADWHAIDAAGGAARSLTVRAAGALFEPDLLFLSPDETGEFRLRGGALCFPTGWALEEKIGHSLDFIHGAVPGLNVALASPIRQFLERMKPGVAFLRENWGLAGTDEFNLHPSRGIPPPAPPVDLLKTWLRVEHQALLSLKSGRGVVFGIRVALHRLDGLAGSAAGAGLRRALASMPPELVTYKRIEGVREAVINRLG
ncbi:MAG: DUF3445 domain-containing protein [Verrucomicrobia bacterium]|nr:DUF3445 domain-containing protein [Verrucomicrobiota bacterium]